jgi:hypothetical protein
LPIYFDDLPEYHNESGNYGNLAVVYSTLWTFSIVAKLPEDQGLYSGQIGKNLHEFTHVVNARIIHRITHFYGLYELSQNGCSSSGLLIRLVLSKLIGSNALSYLPSKKLDKWQIWKERGT